jgi:putative acetyltransferase
VNISIRAERPGDEAAIRAVIAAVFAGVPFSDGSEPGIVAGGAVAGHVAFSPVIIEGGEDGWFGLAPVSVRPDHQRLGIGSRLIEAGIAELRLRAARGVVLVGDPVYYVRFGFERDPRLVYPRPGGEFLQRLVLSGSGTGGVVRYARAFG